MNWLTSILLTSKMEREYFEPISITKRKRVETDNHAIEKLLIKCRKTKTKVITLTNHSRR